MLWCKGETGSQVHVTDPEKGRRRWTERYLTQVANPVNQWEIHQRPTTGGVHTSGLGLGAPTAGSGIATEERGPSTGLDRVPATVDGGESGCLVGGGFSVGDC